MEAVIDVGWSSVVVDYERNNIFYIDSFTYFLLITIVSATFNEFMCILIQGLHAYKYCRHKYTNKTKCYVSSSVRCGML